MDNDSTGQLSIMGKHRTYDFMTLQQNSFSDTHNRVAAGHSMRFDMKSVYKPFGKYRCKILRSMKRFASKSTAFGVLAIAGCSSDYACGGQPLIVLPIQQNGIGIDVPVIIDGVKGRFLFDTGAAKVAVTPDFLKKFRSAPKELAPITLVTPGGATGTARQIELESISIGGSAPANFVAPIFPVMAGIPHGLAGTAWLRNYDVDIDGPSAMVRFYSPKSCPVSKSPSDARFAAVFTNVLVGDIPRIPVYLDGHEFLATLDTGDDLNDVSSDLTKKFGLDSTSKPTGSVSNVNLAAGLPTPSSNRVYGELRIGDDITTVPVFRTHLQADQMVLGMPFFRNHRVVISYALNSVAIISASLKGSAAGGSVTH